MELEGSMAESNERVLVGSAALAPPTVALPEAGARSSGSLSDRGTSEDDLWAVLEAWRPSEVRRDAWEGMFEYVAWKLTLLIGQHHVLAFARDLCDSGRFAQLTLA